MAESGKFVSVDDVVCLLREEVTYWEDANGDASIGAVGALSNCIVTLLGIRCAPWHKPVELVDDPRAVKAAEKTPDVSRDRAEEPLGVFVEDPKVYRLHSGIWELSGENGLTVAGHLAGLAAKAVGVDTSIEKCTLIHAALRPSVNKLLDAAAVSGGR